MHGPHLQQSCWIKPVRCPARAIKIRQGEALQHNAVCQGEICDNSAGKGGGERAVFLVAIHAEDFVQGARTRARSR